MNNKIRLFVDMDGTLAKFNPVTKMETLYEKEYFSKLPPMWNMVLAVKNLVASKDMEVFILSACLDSPYAREEKNQWLDEYLPEIDNEHRIFCEYGKEKSLFISHHIESDVLLDDYTKNLNAWKGVGIKVLNGINDTNKSWKGERINSFCEPNILSYIIKNVMIKAITSKGIEKQMRSAEELRSTKNKNIGIEKEKTHER